jgi:hypothetical protein
LERYTSGEGMDPILFACILKRKPDENGKMRSIETILRMGKGMIKEHDGGGEFN